MASEHLKIKASRIRKILPLLPLTASLVGLLKGGRVKEGDYLKHLLKKHS